MTGPGIFIGIGIAILIVSIFAGSFVRDPNDLDIAEKRRKYMTWWLTRKDRLPGEDG